MRYMLHMSRRLADGSEEGTVSEVDMTGHEVRAEAIDHLNLVKSHLVRDGWDEVTFKKGDVTKRFYKEVDDSPLKWFIEGRRSGWIGPFENRDQAANFAWGKLNEAVRFKQKQADFDATGPDEVKPTAFIILPGDELWPIKDVENGAFHHKCLQNDCHRIVEFDDEPNCFKHSQDEGSSVPGFSARAFVLDSGVNGLNYLPDWIEAQK